MGLDMVITKMVNSRVNEKGNYVYEYEKIADLRNSWGFYENLSSSSDYALNNNTDVEFTGEVIHSCLDNIENETEHAYVKEILEKAEIENSNEEFYRISRN